MVVEHREAEWAELEARAMRLLEDSASASPSFKGWPVWPVLKLSLYPSFAPCQSWTIYSIKPRSVPIADPMVRELTWDRPADRERLLADPIKGLKSGFSTQPSIKFRDAVISAQHLASHLAKGRQVTVEAVVFNEMVVLDGETWSYQTYGVPGHLRVSWWGNGPIEWREFINWTADLLVFLVASLDSKDVTK
jgi:hypothetical protein